jgi:hypothetical protein
MNKRRKTDIDILDQADLIAIAEWVHRNVPDHGISQPTLSRLRNGVLPAMSSDTFQRLLDATLKGDPAERMVFRLWDAVNPPGAWDLQAGYWLWMMDSWRPFFSRRHGRWSVEANKASKLDENAVREKPFPLPRDPKKPLSGVGAVRWANYLALLHRLDQLHIGKELARRLDQWSKRLDPVERYWRITLAEFQILAPLLQGPESAFVERSWEDLSDAEMTAFVRAGIAQHDVLLNRRDMRSRIREVAAGRVTKPARRRTR